MDLLQDAWLDSVEAESKVAGTVSIVSNDEDNQEDAAQDLTSEDIGVIKRRIANVLVPRETVTSLWLTLLFLSDKAVLLIVLNLVSNWCSWGLGVMLMGVRGDAHNADQDSGKILS